MIGGTRIEDSGVLEDVVNANSKGISLASITTTRYESLLLTIYLTPVLFRLETIVLSAHVLNVALDFWLVLVCHKCLPHDAIMLNLPVGYFDVPAYRIDEENTP